MIETPDISAFEPSGAEWDARRDRLVRELRRPAPRRRRRRRIPRLALAFIVVAGTAGAAVASSGWLRGEDAIVDYVACLRTPAQDIDEATFVRTQPDPIAACAALWVDGPVGKGGAPPLAACAGREGAVRVVPADSDAICERLGLAPLPPDYDAFARRQADAQAVVDSVMTGRGGCPATAEPLFDSMRAALAAAGLHGWRVVAPADPEGVMPDCLARVDARARTVTIDHTTPVQRIYSDALGQELGSRAETVVVRYEGRTGCTPARPLLTRLRAAIAEEPQADDPRRWRAVITRLREWRVVADDDAATGESCRAQVDGPHRTITLEVTRGAGP